MKSHKIAHAINCTIQKLSEIKKAFKEKVPIDNRTKPNQTPQKKATEIPRNPLWDSSKQNLMKIYCSALE
jgi:hypothetical protein